MKKIKKIKLNKKYAVIAAVVGLVLLAGVAVKADGGSFLDKVAQFVGVTVGNNINQKINDSGILDTLNVDDLVGALPGNFFTEPVTLFGGTHVEVLATSTGASGATHTFTEKQLQQYGIIEMNPGVNFTFTLPATSTMNILMPKAGDKHSWIIQNATTSTGTTLTLAAGTGWNLTGVDGNVDVIVGAAYTARVSMYIDCYRQSNKDINCGIEEYVAAD